MKIILDINDNKVAFFMEIIKNFKFIKKATPISENKAAIIQDVREAVEEMKLVNQGKLEAKNVEDLINEL